MFKRRLIHNRLTQYNLHNGFTKCLIKILPLSVVALLTVGCASQGSSYQWGSYEKILYNTYINPGETNAREQIKLLLKDVRDAEAEGRAVPPGVHAHLGLIYAVQGDVVLARAAFLLEKDLYPEAASLVDGMISKAFEGS